MNKRVKSVFVMLLLTIVFASVGCGVKKIEIPTESEVETQLIETEDQTDAIVETSTEYNIESEDNSNNIETEDDLNDDKNVTLNSDIILVSTFNYSEDVAWITYQKEEDGEVRYGCIDKEGKLLFYLNDIDMTSSVTPFSNGYSYIVTFEGGSVYVIDKTGSILSAYHSEEGNQIKEYSDGYVWMEKYTSGFDEAYYTYTLYDPKGKSVTEFKYDGTEPLNAINYCGSGVWKYDAYNSDGEEIRRFYCMDSDKWVEVTGGQALYYIHFHENTAVINYSYSEPKLTLLDTEGNITQVSMGISTEEIQGSSIYLYDDYCIIRSGDHLISYKISTGETYKMENEYADRIDWDSIPDLLTCRDDRILVPLIGNDNNKYVGCFSSSWELEYGEPKQFSSYWFSDGRLVIAYDDTVYDSDGKKVFSLEEKGYDYITYYQDGVAYAIPSDREIDSYDTATLGYEYLESENLWDSVYGYTPEYTYVDKNGERLFETIDVASAVGIEVE